MCFWLPFASSPASTAGHRWREESGSGSSSAMRREEPPFGLTAARRMLARCGSIPAHRSTQCSARRSRPMPMPAAAAFPIISNRLPILYSRMPEVRPARNRILRPAALPCKRFRGRGLLPVLLRARVRPFRPLLQPRAKGRRSSGFSALPLSPTAFCREIAISPP